VFERKVYYNFDMSLNIFAALKPLHIPGRKQQTSHDAVLSMTSSWIQTLYFPLVGPDGKDLLLNVNVGEKVYKGQIIGIRQDMYVPSFSSVSGQIVSKEMIYHPAIGRVVPHFVITNDYQDTMQSPLIPLTMDATKEQIIEAIKLGGLTGLGGSGFPTYVKYQHAKNIETILINAVECEPYLSTDYQASQLYALDVLQGSELLRIAGGAKKVIIAFKRTKVAIKEALTPYLSLFPHIEVQSVPDVYPMGWERSLVRTVLHKEYHQYPTEVGVIVSNLTSAIATSDIVLKGKPVLSRILTISGEGIVQPSNVEVPIGTLMSNVVGFLGGYAQEEVTAFIGGPMSAKAVSDDQFAVQPHFGGFTVLTPIASTEEACLRCGACTSNCPANLQPIEIKLALDSQNTARLLKLDAMKCVECGICTYVCPSKIEVTEAVRKGKAKTRIELLKQKLNS
jgi:Na+-translocating ferredoxin:NAD+ oxidoreductase subunit C